MALKVAMSRARRYTGLKSAITKASNPMRILSALVMATGVLVLGSCSGEPDASSSDSAAADFAARIEGGGERAGNAPPTTGDAPRPVESPTVAQATDRADQRAFAQATATDPVAAACDANRMAPFIGLVADARTRIDIEDATGLGREIRFLRPGDAMTSSGSGDTRLNIVLDHQDIIRDARCG